MPRQVSRGPAVVVRTGRRATRRSSRRANKRATSESGHLSGTAITQSFIPLFPTRTTRKLRYCGDFSITAGSGFLTSHVYALNGLYDPDITGTGHQPMGFDTIMLYYEHYHVLSCRWKIVFRNTSDNGGYCGARIDPDASPLVDYIRALENGRMVTDILDKTGTTNSWKELRGSVNLPVVQGLTRANFLADPDLRGNVSSNPTEMTYLHVGIWNPFGSTITCQGAITLEFSAVFTEPRPQSLSLQRIRDLTDDFKVVSIGDVKQ